MALFWDTLFLKVYGVTYKTVDDKVFRPLLTDKIQCEDKPTMMVFGTRNRPGRVGVSVRDFARFGLLYLRGGNWKGKQLISKKHAKMAVGSPLSNTIPRAGRKAAEMIDGQHSIGSESKPDNQSDHFGSYSWLWWINGVDRKGTRMFPDAPHDTYGAFGHGGPRAMWVIPSLDIIVSYNDAKMHTWTSGKKNTTNTAMKLLVNAVVTKSKQDQKVGRFRPSTAVAKKTKTPPYPPSPIINDIRWHFDTVAKYGHGSDQWPMTWANDGNLYAAWGDGNGFANHLKVKQAVGITRIQGKPPKLTGQDIWGIPVSKHKPNAKPQALIAFDGKIYLFFNTAGRGWKESMPAHSDDKGKTWHIGKRSVFDVKQDGVQVKGICQFGRGYTGAPDGYVYVYLAWHESKDIYLGRVKKEHLFDRSKYQYFKALKNDGGAQWTGDFSQKRPVFHDDNKMIWHLSVAYNPAIKRYLLTKPHFAKGDKKWQDVASLGVFDAPRPWGPWTTVYYKDNFRDVKTKFNYVFPTKFMSGDGKTMWLAWSGWPEYDSVSFVKGTLNLTALAQGPAGGLATAAQEKRSRSVLPPAGR